MNINAYKSLSLSLLVAMPFLGGVTECGGRSHRPDPDPDPVLCWSTEECAAGQYCDTDVCMSPCREGEACPAVCYGVCADAPPPPLHCTSDADCGIGARCDLETCGTPPGCGDDPMGPAVCYGTCVPAGPPTCEPVMCALFCEGGFARDPRGCEICACEPPPPPMCEPVTCEIWCEHGFAIDERGCEICACNPEPPVCDERVLCDMWCEYGYDVDERGCGICRCAPPPPGGVCGGFAGFACAPHEFCDYPDDAMLGCGAADHLGVCRPGPEVCPEIYGPVCGCDGASYPNECYANAAGVDVWASGLCAPPRPDR